MDAGLADASADAATDSGTDPQDAGAPSTDAGGPDAELDAGPAGPLEGFGALAGPCGRLSAELSAATPSFYATSLDFMSDPFDDPEDVPALTAGGQELLADGTLGGSSIVSEVFAFEALARCEGATLLKSEGEIVYAVEGTKTDMLVSMEGLPIGVSVTRASRFPSTIPTRSRRPRAC